MKKIYVFNLLALLLLGGCSKDVLDRKPLDRISETIVWNDKNAVLAHLAGSYSMMSVLENETPEKYVGIRPGVGWTIEGQVGATLITNLTDEATWGMYPNWAVYRNSGITINGGLLEWWENSYVIIRQLNEFIEQVPNSSIAEDLKKSLVAEARFLRAYNYFSMVRRYGGVPLITKVQQISDPQEELYPKRNTEKELYDFVIKEMNEASLDLPAVNQQGRASKYAALSLLSRAALYAGSIAEFGQIQLNGLLGIPANEANAYYTKSYEASQKIIQEGVHKLYNGSADKTKNFRDIFLVKGNPEAIFVVQHNDKDMIGSGGNGWRYDFIQGPLPNAWYNGNQNMVYLSFIASTFENVDGTLPDLSTSTLTSKLWTIDELWGKLEPRFFASVYTHGTPWQGSTIDWHKSLKVNGQYLSDANGAYQGTPHIGLQGQKLGAHTSFGVLKYLDENKNNMSADFASSQDWIVFRFAEILLNHAESAFKLGKTAEALTVVNQLRDRAGVKPRTNITFDLIQKERKVELAFEGSRYWDLRRWRIATNVLTKRETGLRYTLDFASKKLELQVLEKVDGGPNVAAIFEPHHYYLPITKTRTQQNTNLEENPNYR
ncbi:RagB/SusD family nutrient uptake outer membrane protein [Sphingobacterium sp. DK4209]|uniref:RagB/SusD family nutrient uptake outer membrane protein n=1 Tax=Sphingobacterium zhuxiongii TaxID=2662364 RepID=A0A5Q0QAI2_9SPHI|nr:MULTISPECIES: RagB/SusD family nutrient uptake outer membrane protein [unclassified Sphingobacterium]MVZ65351.1 RagB/SusD family nutrient uptake outer membrane protein [Sphingobacterium sp. DK4209]QGA26436.1 RagB/SusD family nutrient uptake outer membrane protein [Sphingobacterium sp. dk4302]